ncbi:hypothetical protein Glove_168g163 [Diversispora epigaea]|uniref:HCP-like protein n=1 Tax=Diversispora epigaea TaxID=1348612 RepID=A0A397IWA8_9GLOM|nr:hypothetical protein Glove_168g163 [Diversispora epigaea]
MESVGRTYNSEESLDGWMAKENGYITAKNLWMDENEIDTTSAEYNFHRNGNSNKKGDEKKAFLWYLKSAEGDIMTDRIILDEEKAFKWYLKSAEEGNIIGKYNLGRCYQQGRGTTRHFNGEILQNNLGRCYQHGIGTTDESFQCFLKSAKGGDCEGQNSAGYCYHFGIGTKGEESAFQWYLKSAEGEIVLDRIILVIAISKGLERQKNEEKVFHWYSKSEGGNIGGQNGLGFCYEYGVGTIKDEEKAFQWYLKSAEGGLSYRQSNLGFCYANGFGTTKDEGEAFY